jgi:hypothetical protein
MSRLMSKGWIRGGILFVLKWAGPVAAMDLLALLSLRGRVSLARRELEKQIVSKLRPEGDSLLIGMKSYNYHYACYYSLTGSVTIVEPFTAMLPPPGATWIRDKMQDWQVKAGAYALANFVGVYGWGLNDQSDLNLAAKQISKGLRPGGRLIFAFNEDRDPLDLVGCEGHKTLFPDIRFEPVVALTGGLLVYVGTKLPQQADSP